MFRWLCLRVNITGMSTSETLVRELSRSLGKDFGECRVLDGEGLGQRGENLALLKVRDFDKNKEKVRSCLMVISPMNSYDNPQYLSEREVSEFFTSMIKDDQPDVLEGDLILMKPKIKGADVCYLSGLYGVVVESGKKKHKVWFRLESTTFFRKVETSCFDLVYNICEETTVSPFKQPCTRGYLAVRGRKKLKEAVKRIVSEDKIHRKKRREYKGRRKA